MAAPSQTLPRDAAWLFGRNVDLLLGAGVGYLLSFPLLLWLALDGRGQWPILGVAAISLFVSAPHYGATLLRVYAKRADRHRYAFFAFHLSAILLLAFIGGVYSATLGSLLVTLYVTWSPWHVSGQNYGISLMFLRRRGVPVPLPAKRLLYAVFILSTLLSFLSIHVAGSSFVPAAGSAAASYSVLRLGLPVSLVGVLAPLLLLAYLGSIVAALRLFARGAGWRDLVPVVCLIVSQSLWFVVPAMLFVGWGENAERLLPFAAIWISASHSLQYVWVTTYYAKRSDPGTDARRYLVRTLLAGLFITIVPGLLFAPALLGATPWNAGLGALLFAVVNIHHFALDGAVWKLRDGQVAKALLRSGAAEAASDGPIQPERGGLVWRLIFAGGALALVVTAYELYERQVTLVGITSQLDRAERALDRLGWIGRDAPRERVRLGQAYARRGQPERAEVQYRRSLALQPTSEAWQALGDLERSRKSWPEAQAAYRAALRIEPDDAVALFRLSGVLAKLEQREVREVAAQGRAAEFRRAAIEALERAIELRPEFAQAYPRLARCYTREGRPAEARALLEGALARVAPRHRASLESELARIESASDES